MANADPQVRVRVAGIVYECTAVAITDPAARTRLLGDAGESHWVWRLDPRA
jgi:hypothetical protein